MGAFHQQTIVDQLWYYRALVAFFSTRHPGPLVETSAAPCPSSRGSPPATPPVPDRLSGLSRPAPSENPPGITSRVTGSPDAFSSVRFSSDMRIFLT